MEKLLIRLTTVAPDSSKHIVGAVYTNFLGMMITAFLGDKIGMYYYIGLLITFILWEVYWNFVKKNPISIKDIMVAVIVILPSLMYLIKLNTY